jgi:hypothetical protein
VFEYRQAAGAEAARLEARRDGRRRAAILAEDQQAGARLYGRLQEAGRAAVQRQARALRRVPAKPSRRQAERRDAGKDHHFLAREVSAQRDTDPVGHGVAGRQYTDGPAAQRLDLTDQGLQWRRPHEPLAPVLGD